jgi:integrase
MAVKVRFWKRAWWVFVHHDGRRKAKRVGDKDTAHRVAQAVRETIARGGLNLTPSIQEQTLEAFATSWLAVAKSGLKASTVAFYEGALDQHILPALDARPVASLGRPDCRHLIAACRAKGLKVSTVRGVARTLSTILSQAVEDNLLAANPALRLGRYLRYGDDAEPQPDPLAQTEVLAVLGIARERFPDWYPSCCVP